MEHRTQRAGEMSKSVQTSLRHVMARSDKNNVVKKIVVRRGLTQEEIDFRRYIDNDPNNPMARSQPTVSD